MKGERKGEGWRNRGWRERAIKLDDHMLFLPLSPQGRVISRAADEIPPRDYVRDRPAWTQIL